MLFNTAFSKSYLLRSTNISEIKDFNGEKVISIKAITMSRNDKYNLIIKSRSLAHFLLQTPNSIMKVRGKTSSFNIDDEFIFSDEGGFGSFSTNDPFSSLNNSSFGSFNDFENSNDFTLPSTTFIDIIPSSIEFSLKQIEISGKFISKWNSQKRKTEYCVTQEEDEQRICVNLFEPELNDFRRIYINKNVKILAGFLGDELYLKTIELI